MALGPGVVVFIGGYVRPGQYMDVFVIFYDVNNAISSVVVANRDLYVHTPTIPYSDPTGAVPTDLWQEAVWDASGAYRYGFPAPQTVGGHIIRVDGIVDGTNVHGCVGFTVDNRLDQIYAADVVNFTELIGIIRQNRPSNVRIDFVKATAENSTRNVAIGAYDRVSYSVKADDAEDWSSPITSGVLYFWYDVLGAINPTRVGENG